jgi:hypothetical protein
MTTREHKPDQPILIGVVGDADLPQWRTLGDPVVRRTVRIDHR